MKLLLLLLLFTFIYLGCTTKENNQPYSYIKIGVWGSPDSVNMYNKGAGFYSYAYYNHSKDSLVYKFVPHFEKGDYQTYAGNLNNESYRDTLNQLAIALSKYPNGSIKYTGPAYDTYCGPQLYVEFEDEKGIHFYSFDMNDDDTINNFFDFFERLKTPIWRKKIVDNQILNLDNEVVHAMKNLGVYDQRPLPYIPFDCENEIDMSKLYGVWRSVSNDRPKQDKYRKLIFQNDGNCFYEKINDGISTGRTDGKFVVKKNTIIIRKDTSIFKLKVVVASDNCLKIKSSTNDTATYNRLSEN